jgi:hypothetical protein
MEKQKDKIMNVSMSWSIKMIVIVGYFICNLYGVALSSQLGSTDSTTIKVFILAGQSNAVGYNHINEYTGNREKLPKEIDNLTNVIFWPGSNSPKEFSGKWIKMQIGVSGISGQPPYFDGCFGPEVGFAIKIVESLPEDEIAIIKFSEGATGIAQSSDYTDYIPALVNFNDKGINWHPPVNGDIAGQLYTNLLKNISEALSVLKKAGNQQYEICGFLWMQGEHEAGISRNMAKDYGSLLTLFRDAVRKDLNLKELPFAIGEINSHTWAFGDIARKQQLEACNKDANIILIKTTDLPRGGIGGEAHFTADGMLMLGDRFAKGMLELLGDKTKSTQITHENKGKLY